MYRIDRGGAMQRRSSIEMGCERHRGLEEEMESRMERTSRDREREGVMGFQ
jgi:hypothetical protein